MVRIVSKEEIILETPVAVYDISVPSTENFVLKVGYMVVHNSKDLSDAITGALENARTSGKGRMMMGRTGHYTSRLTDPIRQVAANFRQTVSSKTSETDFE